MPKKKVTKAKPKRVSSSWTDSLRHPVGFYKRLSGLGKLLLLSLLFLIGFIVIVNISNYLDQRRLEKDFRKIQSDLQNLNMENRGFKISTDCRSTVEKYSDGSLFCTVAIGKENPSRNDYSMFIKSVEGSKSWQIINKSEPRSGINYTKIIHTPSKKSCTLDVVMNKNNSSMALVCSEYSARKFY